MNQFSKLISQLQNHWIVVFSILLNVILYLGFAVVYPYSFNFEININAYFLMYYLITAIVLFWIMAIKKRFKFQIWELSFIISLSALFFLWVNSSYFNWSNEHLFVIGLSYFLIGFGVVAADSLFTKWLLPLILLVFFFEVCYGLYQISTLPIYETNRSLKINGTFKNSGIYSIYLTTHFPLLFFFIFKSKATIFFKKFFSSLPLFLYFLIAFACCVIFYISLSRTAILAFLFFNVLYIYKNVSAKLFIFFRKNFWTKCISIFIILASIVYLAFCFFNLKRLSAVGRLLTWNVTLGNVKEYIWSGTGLGRFTWYYPQWQAEYFSLRREHNDFFISSGETYMAFNEFLQFFSEIGLPGFLALVFVFIRFYSWRPLSDKKVLGYFLKQTVTLILFCSLFSYPLHVSPIIYLLLFCFWNAKPARSIPLLGKPPGERILMVLCLAIFLISAYSVLLRGIKTLKAVTLWKSANELGNTRQEMIKKYRGAFSVLKNDGKFLADYGEFLMQDSSNIKDAVNILEKGKMYFLSRKIMEDLSFAYRASGRYDKALIISKQLSDYLPGAFRPQYNLMTLHLLNKDTVSAQKIATNILGTPIKIPSAEVNEIRLKAKSTLRLITKKI